MCHKILATLLCASATIFIYYIPVIMATPNMGNLHIRDGLHVPCSFFDTVNVTGDMKFANGSYLHEGILIPSHLVGIYDYIYKDTVTREDVEPHYRGCICKLKTCINFCCPWGSIFHANISQCVNITTHKMPESKLNVTMSDHGQKTVAIFEEFAVQYFRPCEIMYSLQPEVEYYDEWILFENGTLLRIEDMAFLDKLEFCFVPTLINGSEEYFAINPANCKMNSDYGTMKIINAYAMLFSIPFMILTIIVYLTIPELRNQHGKSLVCYLLGLIIGYSLLSLIALGDNIDTSEGGVSCKVIGYTSYYFFMAAFFWLSVISFDLWHNFRGTRGVNRFQEKKRFFVYSLYSWGVPLLFLGLTFYAQEYAEIPDIWRPGIGGGEYCWLDMRLWSAMIYFFGPIVLIIAANTVMFVMTAIKIHKVQREMARIMAREDSTKNLRTEKDKFGLFLRLFIVMGVTWSMEILSYFVGSDKSWSKIFYIPDICNAIQGFLIFMLFVMKKKVKHLITNRYSSTRDSSNQRQSQYSTKTTTSSVANLSLTNSNPSERPLVLNPERRDNTVKL